MTSIYPSSSVLLGSDFPMFRESLKEHFECVSDFEIVACANNPTEVLSLVTSVQPRLVLLDLNVPLEGLCSLLDRIHSASTTRVLVMADSLDNASVIQALQHGAHGVIARRTTAELFIKSIRAILSGEYWISRGTLSEVMRVFREATIAAPENVVEVQESVTPDTSVLGLTQRERQIIDTLVDGQTNKDIAATLNISEYTVKHHLTNIFDRLGFTIASSLSCMPYTAGFLRSWRMCKPRGGGACQPPAKEPVRVSRVAATVL